jgi:acetyltransferase-like isoleucine patch superfamily enzyme
METIMDARIRNNRELLIRFLKGAEQKLEFEIDCPMEQRIKFIYSIIFPGFSKIRFNLRFLIARIAQYIDYSPVKVFLYRLIGMKIGKGVFLSPDVILDPHFPELIDIGDYAIIGWGTHLFCHDFSGSKYYVGRITIGKGAVIGGFSVVRGGVTIGENAQVASTCIVYKDVPQNYYLDSVVLLNRALVEVYRQDIGAADTGAEKALEETNK